MDDFGLHLATAAGFLKLCQPEAAWAELERIEPPGRRVEVPVLALRLNIYLELERWPAAEVVARDLAAAQPEEPAWPLTLAVALRQTGGITAARAIVARAASRFPGVAAFPYALACYAAQSGMYGTARRHLEAAFRLAPDLRLVALSEPDLEPFWLSLGKPPSGKGAS